MQEVRMKTLRRLIIVGLLAACVVGQVRAIGKVYARIPNNQNSPIYALRIKSLRASVVIRDQLAVTHVDQEFSNDNSMRLEGFYVFQLPDGAQVNEMYLWVNGVRVPYTVKKRADAVVVYQDIVTHMADPAVLEQLGTNLFKLRIFPFNAMSTRRIEIVYSQPLTYYKGTIQYTFPMDMREYTSAPIELVSISVDVKSRYPVLSVQTSIDQFPAAVSSVRVDDSHWTVVYGVENVSFAKDFAVRCDVDRGGHWMVPLTYAPPDSLHEDPYALLWIAIPDTLYGDSVVHREITFVADISSSMDGTRLLQVKDALLSFLDFLTEQDDFNIIAFGTATVKFSPDLLPGSGTAKTAARQFVGQLSAKGLTNIEAAMHDALNQSYHDSSHSAIVFLTDGQPSWGETNPDSLLAKVGRWDPKKIPIFPISIGNEPDVHLLAGMAEQSGGLMSSIAEDDSIFLKMKDLYRLLFLPSIHDASVNFRSLADYDVFPSPLPSLHAGDQFLVSARFLHLGADSVDLSGTVGGVSISVRDWVNFGEADTVMPAVSRYWAAQKIRWLLALIDLVGEKAELVDQVIALSTRYSVLTPYTAFLVVEPAAGPGGTGVAQEQSGLPLKFALLQNYPNPFNPATRIEYEVAHKERIILTVFDLLGRVVALLVDDVREPGRYAVQFDGAGLASGTYFCRMEAGAFVETRTLLLLR
jgi:Ca-activated chloride channel family protein